MSVKTIPLTAVSVQSAKSSTRFGSLTVLPLFNAAWIFARAALTGIPANAVVTSATLTFRSRNSPTWAGTRTVKARYATGPFSTATTWANKPASSTTNEATTTQTNAPFGANWNLDVAAIVQAWVAGTVTNNGFLIYTSDSSAGSMQGTGASWGPPVLTVEYSVSPVLPTGLNPDSGAVSKDKPTLQFQAPADTSAIQVQVDQPVANQIPNPSADVNTTGWGVSGGTLVRDATIGYGSTGAFKLTTASGSASDSGYMYLSPFLSAGPGPRSAAARVSGTGKARLQIYANPGAVLIAQADVVLTSGWQPVQAAGVAPSGTTEVYSIIRQNTAGAQTLNVDTITLTPTPTPHHLDASGNMLPSFDSGEMAASAGLLDLSATDYPGLPDGASTQWRTRVKNALGWSAWSSWVPFSRAAWKAIAITSPGSTSEDPSPTVEATYAGVITAWRIYTQTAAGVLVQDSGWTPGSAVSFATTKSVGAAGLAVVCVRDNVTRDATPGDPDYTFATKAFTVTASETPSPIASLAAASDGIKAEVVLTGTRGTIPDEVAIYRNGTLVARVAGGAAFAGTAFSYRDRTAPMNTPATYSVQAIAAGAWSAVSTSSPVTPRCKGIWLYDSTSDDAVLLLGDEDFEQSQPEVAIVHRPVSGPDGDPQVVRRRLARFPREGTLDGILVDAVGVTAAASEVALRRWVDYDAGHVYRLVLGNQNDPVILGDLTFEEVSENGKDRALSVAANWWYQG